MAKLRSKLLTSSVSPGAEGPPNDRIGEKRPRPRDQFMLTERPPGDPLRLISMDETSRRVMFCKVHIYRLISEGRFPRQVKIGLNRVAFVEAEVDAWVRERIAQREGKAA
jgi:prophage regulatory protein